MEDKSSAPKRLREDPTEAGISRKSRRLEEEYTVSTSVDLDSDFELVDHQSLEAEKISNLTTLVKKIFKSRDIFEDAENLDISNNWEYLINIEGFQEIVNRLTDNLFSFDYSTIDLVNEGKSVWESVERFSVQDLLAKVIIDFANYKYYTSDSLGGFVDPNIFLYFASIADGEVLFMFLMDKMDGDAKLDLFYEFERIFQSGQFTAEATLSSLIRIFSWSLKYGYISSASYDNMLQNQYSTSWLMASLKPEE